MYCSIYCSNFDMETIWGLRNHARKEALDRFHDTPIVIDIASSSEQCLSRLVTASGSAENDRRIVRERKFETHGTCKNGQNYR